MDDKNTDKEEKGEEFMELRAPPATPLISGNPKQRRFISFNTSTKLIAVLIKITSGGASLAVLLRRLCGANEEAPADGWGEAAAGGGCWELNKGVKISR